MSLSQDASDNTRTDVRSGQLSPVTTTRKDYQGVIVDSPASFAIEDDIANDATVGTLTSDAGDKVFSIVEGNDDGIFKVSAAGVLAILDNTEIEVSTYNLVVKVVSAGHEDFANVEVVVSAA